MEYLIETPQPQNRRVLKEKTPNVDFDDLDDVFFCAISYYNFVACNYYRACVITDANW